MKKITKIAILGELGSGKDTAAQMFAAVLHEKYPNRVRKSLANKVKLMISTLTGVGLKAYTSPFYTYPYLDFTREQKNLYLEDWDMTLGQMLQKFATEVCRDNFREDVWIKGLELDFDYHGLNFITDMRFKNEVEYFGNDEETLLVKIKRGDNPFLKSDTRDLTHSSETEMLGISENLFDIILENGGSLEDLLDKIENICCELELVKRGSLEGWRKQKILNHFQ